MGFSILKLQQNTKFYFLAAEQKDPMELYKNSEEGTESGKFVEESFWIIENGKLKIENDNQSKI